MFWERVWTKFPQPWGIFYLFPAASWEVYKALLKLVRWVLSCPLLMCTPPYDVFYMTEDFSVTFTFSKIYKNSEWLRLALVLELNLFLQRPRIRQHLLQGIFPGIKPKSLTSPALIGVFFNTNATCEAHIVLFIMAVPFHIPTSGVKQFQFLYILVNICFFSQYPSSWLWSVMSFFFSFS